MPQHDKSSVLLHYSLILFNSFFFADDHDGSSTHVQGQAKLFYNQFLIQGCKQQADQLRKEYKSRK